MGKSRKIKRSGLTGGDRKTIISQGLGEVKSITVDLADKRIIWTDSFRDTLESADYNGQNRRIIRRRSHTNFNDIAIYRVF